MPFEKDQRVKLTITGFELPGRVTGTTPTADGKGQWVTIKFISGPVGCYHSQNVVIDEGRARDAKTWDML